MPGGGSNLDVVGCCDDEGLTFVLTHQETSAAIMAGVAGELTGAPGVALATRGPGAASAVNGVANALLERAPMLMITDCVIEADAERVSHQRLDQQALLGTVALDSVRLSSTNQQDLQSLVADTLVQPPGPIHIDIDPTSPELRRTARSVPSVTHQGDWQALLSRAERPVLIVGVGILTSGPRMSGQRVAELNSLAGQLHVPVLTTYKARGVVPDGAEYSAGIVTGGVTEADLLSQADLIIGVGLDPVELLPTSWPYRAPMILVNSWEVRDSSFFGASVAAQITGDIAEALAAIGPQMRSTWPSGAGAGHWQTLVAAARSTVDVEGTGLIPSTVIDMAAQAFPRGSIATVDAGAHMLVAMPLWPVDEPHRVLISSAHATMGFAIPASIAASLIHPERRVIAFTGDAGLGMVLGELETIRRLDLPICVIVFNDSSLSLIAVKQRPLDQGGERAFRYGPIDFARIAEGCGLRGVRAESVEAYEAALREAQDSKAPILIDVIVDPRHYSAIYPALRG